MTTALLILILIVADIIIYRLVIMILLRLKKARYQKQYKARLRSK